MSAGNIQYEADTGRRLDAERRARTLQVEVSAGAGATTAVLAAVDGTRYLVLRVWFIHVGTATGLLTFKHGTTAVQSLAVASGGNTNNVYVNQALEGGALGPNNTAFNVVTPANVSGTAGVEYIAYPAAGA